MASKTKKNSSSKKSSPSSNGTKRQKTEIRTNGKLNPQVKAILMLAGAVVLLVLALFKGEHLWHWLHSFMFGMFGFCSYLLPVALGYFAIMTAKEKQINRPEP